MTKQQLLQELEGLVIKLNINIRYEKGNIKGGLCRVHKDLFLIINKQLTLEDKIDIIVHSLKGLPTDEIYIPPQIRSLLN
ncbi:MAG: hypothetical protein V1872_11345 [bacterium]